MKKCRICKGRLKKIIDFGKISLVGNFLTTKSKQKKYSLSLNFCKNCKHVQIAEILNPDLLFKNYFWETGISQSNIKILNNFLKRLKELGLKKNSKVIEIASNDGSFLRIIKKKFKNFSIGVDPAKNLANKANKKKIYTINNYFSYKLSRFIKKKFKSFDFVFARNVVAHLKNPNDIFKGVRLILKDNGIFILEVPHLLSILNKNQYDNIFHEHISFHSIKSIKDLCNLNNLKIFHVEKIDSQGGSIRCYICKKNNKRNASNYFLKFSKEEKNSKLFNDGFIMQFKKRIIEHNKKILKMIKNLKLKGNKISIYGASGKGQALLQFCKIGNNLIDYVFDKSKIKQNRYTPGTNIKILNPSLISRDNVDFLLILSWNIKNEIMKQEINFRKNGGKFIIPFPNPRILK